MPSPSPYNVSYSFSGWQALNPQKPLPSSPLDNELAAIQSAISLLIAALSEVRRDDGNLQNASVTWDGLSEDVKARITGADPRVTVGDINPAAFSTQAEDEAGVTSDKITTPLGVARAIASLRAFATQLQAQAGVSGDTVMTPLSTTQQLDALRKFATEAEAAAGASGSTVLSPATGKHQLDTLRKVSRKTQSLTWGAVPATGSLDQTVTIAGAAVGERVITGLPAAGIDAGLVVTAWVSSADNVNVRITNITGSPITPYAGTSTPLEITVVGF